MWSGLKRAVGGGKDLQGRHVPVFPPVLAPRTEYLLGRRPDTGRRLAQEEQGDAVVNTINL